MRHVFISQVTWTSRTFATGQTISKELHERPLHSSKVTVWYALSSHGVIGPYFFENYEGITVTVTSERFVAMLETFVTPALNNFPEFHEVWLGQDGATSHTARWSMKAVRELLGNSAISRFGDNPWPPKSPDFPLVITCCGLLQRSGLYDSAKNTSWIKTNNSKGNSCYSSGDVAASTREAQ